MEFSLLGKFEVRIDGAVVVNRGWNRSKAKALLKLLALQPSHALHREQVLDALWPDLDPAGALNNLHKNLHYLRTRFAPHPSPVTLERDLLALAGLVIVDVETFRQAAGTALEAGDRAALEAAIPVYAGALLPEDLYEPWTEAPRDELRATYLQVLQRAAEATEQAGDSEAAAHHLQALLRADPLHEPSHAALMRLYARAGSRHRALLQYQTCRDLLRKQLEVDPSEETEALYHRIRSGDFPPARATAASRPPGHAGGSPRHAVPAIYGREAELRELEAAVEDAEAGRGGSLLLVGTAGIGKSHLLAQAAEMVEEAGGLGLTGRSFELSANLPYQPVRSMLQQVLTHGGAPAGLLGNTLYLKRLLSGQQADTIPVLDPGELQAALFQEAQHFVAELARAASPVLLAFDDLHYADDATIRLLHTLARATPQSGVLILGTHRLEDVRPGQPLAALLTDLRRDRLVREVPVAPLQITGLALMLQELLDGRSVEPAVVDEVAQVTGGNPLFARELVLGMRNQGVLQVVDGRWQRVRRERMPVPGAVQDLLAQRLSALGEMERAALQAASVAGRTFDFALLRECVEGSEGELLDALDACLGAGLIEETPAGYAFIHELTRQALYSGQSRARRQRTHRAVAEALVAAGAGVEHAGYHYQESDEPWHAVEYLRAAGNQAAAVFANEQAVAFYQQALDIAQAHAARVAPEALAQVHEDMGDLLRRLGDMPGSVAQFTAAVALHQQSGQEDALFRARAKAALGQIVEGDFAHASDFLEQTLASMNEQSPHMVVARTYYLLAQLRWHNAQYRGALEAAEQALVAAERVGDTAHRARAYEVLALACHSLGDWQRGVEYELNRHTLGAEGFDTDEAFDAHL